jgi:hypothetical protein
LIVRKDLKLGLLPTLAYVNGAALRFWGNSVWDHDCSFEHSNDSHVLDPANATFRDNGQIASAGIGSKASLPDSIG